MSPSRRISVLAFLLGLWNGCMTRRDHSQAKPPSDESQHPTAARGDSAGEIEIGRVRDGVIIRGRAPLPTVPPGSERQTFLAAAARALEVSVDSLDLAAPIVARYGADELQVYECVQRAEDIWRVQLLPERIPVPDFEAALEPFATLEAIIGAAEAAARRRGRP